MTISTTTNRWSYTGDGSTAAFAYTNKILEDSDLKVYVGGTLKTLTTHYTVSGAGDVSGGSVTFTAGNIPAAAASVIIVRDIPTTQGTDFLDAGAFPAANTEDAVDKLTIISQQQDDDISRTLRQPETDASAIGRLPAKADRLGKLLQFNSSTGDPEVVAAADLSLSTVTPFAETLLDDTTPAAARSTLGAGAVGENVFTAATAAAAQQAMDTEVGVDVQAYDADLAAIAALSHTRGNVPQSNGSAWVASAALLPDNLLVNGSFDVWQRGTSFTSTTTPANSDNTYLADRWILLSDGNDIADISRETTTIPSGAVSAIKIDIETANKKLALVQILEQKDAAAIIGGTASLAFEACIGGPNATLGTMRAYLASWGGTADSVTSDLIGTWPAAGADPTLAANWTLENAGSDLTLTTSYQEFRVENASIDTASTKNVAVILMIDDADATVGDLLYISKVRLVPGAVATPIKRRPFTQELALCQRYYEKTFELGTAPAQAAGLLGTLVSIGISGSTGPVCTWQFKATKRVAPTITTYSPLAANANWRDTSNATTVTASVIASTGVNAATIGAGAAATSTSNFHIHATAAAEL